MTELSCVVYIIREREKSFIIHHLVVYIGMVALLLLSLSPSLTPNVCGFHVCAHTGYVNDYTYIVHLYIYSFVHKVKLLRSKFCLNSNLYELINKFQFQVGNFLASAQNTLNIIHNDSSVANERTSERTTE